MAKIHTLTAPRKSQMLDYSVNVYKDDEFVTGWRFEGFSGTAVQEEVIDIRKEYPASEGYTIDW